MLGHDDQRTFEKCRKVSAPKADRPRAAAYFASMLPVIGLK